MTTYASSRPGQASTADVEAYVRRCVACFDDLPATERASLEHDVREIVAEVTAELDGSPADLVGPPHRFAADLRNAAGLPPSEECAAVTTSQQRESSFSIARRWLRTVVIPWCRELAGDLRPAWWVARGIGLAMIVAPNPIENGGGAFPDVGGSHLLWLIIAVAAVVASVTHGRRETTNIRTRVVTAFASVVAVALLLNYLTVAAYRVQYPFGDYAMSVEVAGDIAPVDVVAVENSFSVYDTHTGQQVFASTQLIGADLLAVLESSPAEAIDGFRVEFFGQDGFVEGQVSTWEAVIALANSVVRGREGSR